MRLAVGLVVALALGGCAAPAPSEPVATDHVDLPPSYRFVPADIVVADGATVTWTNSDNFTHSVRLVDDGGEVLVIAPGATVSHTFTGPGVHDYDCSFHAQDMRGTVTVTEAS